MKKLPIAFLACFCFMFISADNRKAERELVQNGFKLIPSGFLLNGDLEISINAFYLFETEITNRQYSEFLSSIKNKKEIYNICKIDSTGWNRALNFENSYSEDYHLTAEFADYPVVNISYEAANYFCRWLEEKLNKKQNLIEVRLPSAEEWLYAAKGGKKDAVYPWENIEIGNKNDFELCNYNSTKDGTCLATNYSKSYLPNAYGLYNMSGNVAEILSEQGTSAGGSWDNSLEAMKLDKSNLSSKIQIPSAYVGFRPIAIIRSNNQ